VIRKISSRGFTIVELLVVIVVIGVLAAVTVVAYNGIQQRAQNAKTQQALAAWLKGLQLYKAENGRWPAGWNCLGEGYLYGPTGTETSGVAQCRQTNSTTYVVENPSFNVTMKPYIGNTIPTPAFVTARSTDTLWYRGLMYAYGGGGTATDVYIQAAYAGAITCPPVGGVTPSLTGAAGGNTACYYQVGYTTDT